MQRFIVFLCALGLLAGLYAPAFAAGKVEIKLAGMKPEGEPETVGMHNFGKYLKELSNGKYDVKVYPNNQLGTEDTYIAQTRKGIIQMCATGPQTSVLHPAMAMLEAPMLYDSLDHARRAMEGKTLDLITAGFTEKSGLRVLNAFPLGFRHFYTKKPIATMDDLKGLRMRVPNIPLYINFAKACGISGQHMPFADVPAALDRGATDSGHNPFGDAPSALDQGVIDGGDSPFADIIALKMYEITPQITTSGHILVIHSLYINEAFYQKLPEQDKAWINEAAKRSADDVWKLVAASEAKAVDIITKGGGTVSVPSKEFHAALVKAGEESWTHFYKTVPNAKEILDSAASYR